MSHQNEYSYSPNMMFFLGEFHPDYSGQVVTDKKLIIYT